MDNDAKKELKDARAALAKVRADNDNDPAYKAANDRVNRAEKALPWRKR